MERRQFLRASAAALLVAGSARLSGADNRSGAPIFSTAIQRGMTFRQQMDPLTGELTQADLPSYSPAALAMVDFTWRLAGVRETENQLEWNVCPSCAASEAAHFSTHFDRNRTAGISYDKQGADLRLDSKSIGRIESGTARLITDKQGRPKLLTGISERVESVSLRLGHTPPSASPFTPISNCISAEAMPIYRTSKHGRTR